MQVNTSLAILVVVLACAYGAYKLGSERVTPGLQQLQYPLAQPME